MNTPRKYNVIYRACDVVNAVNKNPRPYDLTKGQLIKICFQSLVDSLQGHNYRIIVLGDKLSDDMVSFFKSYDLELQLGVFGNDASIREAVKIALTIPDGEWVYFCEDDYLHVSQSFSYIDSFLDDRNTLFRRELKPYNLSSIVNLNAKDLFIYPPDYPDRYRPKYRMHSQIVVSKDCHWRQVNSCTFTFLTESSSVRKYADVLIRCSKNANDRRMSRAIFGRYAIFAKAVCFSPIPGLSSHMHRDTMTPLINWKDLVDGLKRMLKL